MKSYAVFLNFSKTADPVISETGMQNLWEPNTKSHESMVGSPNCLAAIGQQIEI